MTSVAGLKIAFIGLGAIGSRIAGRLHESGLTVTVHNRTLERQTVWLESHPGAVGATNPAEAVAGADVVITCVGDDNDLRDVYFGEQGVLNAVGDGTLVIDHTTASDAIARELSLAVVKKGGRFLDAPVSGGSAGAEAGTLSVMCGGTVEAFEPAVEVLAVYGRNIVHVGPAGAGQLCKMVNQVCIAGVLEGLAEGIGLAEAAGLDVSTVLNAIRGGAAGSWQMENRSSYMVKREYPAGFAARLMHKDLGLGGSSADAFGVDAPLLELVRARYTILLERGLGDEDFTNLFRLVLPNN
jgi:3-hydroxyisobutyrate dehydrogenase